MSLSTPCLYRRYTHTREQHANSALEAHSSTHRLICVRQFNISHTRKNINNAGSGVTFKMRQPCASDLAGLTSCTPF